MEWEISVVSFASLHSGEYIFGFIEISSCGNWDILESGVCIVFDVGHPKFQSCS